MSQRKAAIAPDAPEKSFFKAPDVAARLAALKKAAVEDGKEESAWWTPALTFEWSSLRKPNNGKGNGTQWVSVNFTDAAGTTARLIVRVNNERHTGQIMPTEAGVAKLAAQNPNMEIVKRTKKPSVQIQKWAAQVKTAEDGVTVLTDADGQPMLPGDEKLSTYYKVACLVNEAFTSEAKERVDRGTALLKKAVEMKRADKAVTAQAVIEAFATDNGPRRPGDMILSSESVGAFRKLFPAQKDSDLLTKGAIITSNVKIANLVQEYISDQAKKNAGLRLPNPMTRVAMNFDEKNGMAKMDFYDKNLSYKATTGKTKYEVGKVDGNLINVDNVHEFVLRGSSIDGIFNLDSVCLSNMGISMPVAAKILVVGRPSSREFGLEDIYDDDDDGDGVSSTPAPAAGAEETAAPHPDTRAAPAAAAPAEENYDDLLGELGGDPVSPAK